MIWISFMPQMNEAHELYLDQLMNRFFLLDKVRTA
jgi:hypothetical protein